MTRLAFVAQAVGVALDVEDGGAMEEAVQDGAGHGGVLAEDLVPVAKGFVAGEDDGPLLLVALADDLEEKAGLQMIEFEVADFVDLSRPRDRSIYADPATIPTRCCCGEATRGRRVAVVGIVAVA